MSGLDLPLSRHTRHSQAVRWFDSTSTDTLAFCRVTQTGFLRLLTNSHVMRGDALTSQAAWRRLDRVYRSIRRSPRFLRPNHASGKCMPSHEFDSQGGTEPVDRCIPRGVCSDLRLYICDFRSGDIELQEHRRPDSRPAILSLENGANPAMLL
jgi:hypothetical protein